MNPPSQSDYLIANPLSLAAIFVVSLGLLTNCCVQLQNHGSPSWFLPLIALWACREAGNARKRVAAYRSWQRAWQEMSGEALIAARKRQRQRIGWVLAGISIWFLMLGWLFAGGNAPATPAHYAALLIVIILPAWAVRAVLRRVARFIGPAVRSADRPSGHVVSGCLPLPSRSPAPAQIAAALPEYCRALLAGGTAQAS